MSEIKENSTVPTWHDIQRAYADAFMEVIENASRENNLASETIAGLQKQCAKKDNIIWHTVTIAFLSVIASVLIMNVRQEKSETQWRQTMERMNQGWVDYLSQYDFVTQDGTGINYYNADIGGDVNNGAASAETEEPEES